MIDISLNGERRQLEPQMLSAALEAWGYQCERVAVAINGEFIARADYARTPLTADDRIDVVGPVQGG
jgi:sulfur carrier protein